MNNDLTLRILILRTIKVTQEGVAHVLRCSRRMVGDAEKWFGKCPQQEAEEFVNDENIRALVELDLPGYKLLSSDELLMVGKVRGDAILLHYGRPRRRERIAPGHESQLGRHWDRLGQLAVRFREELVAPGIREIFDAEVCRRAYFALKSGATLRAGFRQGLGVEVPPGLLMPDRASGEAASVSLAIEDETLLSHLLAHLEVEFDGFGGFGEWKGKLGRAVATCLRQANRVSRDCGGEEEHSSHGPGQGLTWQFPAYVCYSALSRPGDADPPELIVEEQPDDTWRLTPGDYPAFTLAAGNQSYLSGCHAALLAQIEAEKGLDSWLYIKKELDGLEEDSLRLRGTLDTVIDRGSFLGLCSLCREFSR